MIMEEMLAAARRDSSSQKDPLVTARHHFAHTESTLATPKGKCQCLMDMAAADALVVAGWRNQEVQKVLEVAKDQEVEGGASSA